MRTYISLGLSFILLGLSLLNFLQGRSLNLSIHQLPTPMAIILPKPHQGATPVPYDPAQEQYYRGMYDLCAFLLTQKRPWKQAEIKTSCLEIVRRADQKKWFEHKTPGWHWRAQ